jgi:toxin YoeB
MGKYLIVLSKRARKDLKKIHQSGNKQDIKRVEKIFLDLSEQPRFGIGNPERIKYKDGEIWSREINKKDRIVYEIFEFEQNLLVVQALGHYDDK